MSIDFNLVESTIDLDSFNVDITYPILFFGTIIKNEYDNRRIQLNSEYNPVKFLHFNKDASNLYPFYGLLLEPTNEIKLLQNTIMQQEDNGDVSLLVYENILNQFDLSCKETYGWFDNGVYPIDFSNLKQICVDKFNDDKRILQHILGLDETVFDFQKFASLNLFVLTPFDPELIK